VRWRKEALSAVGSQCCKFLSVAQSWLPCDEASRVCLLLQYLIQSCARGGRRIVEDMCYEIRRAEACVD
jgi:hypothetical protein